MGDTAEQKFERGSSEEVIAGFKLLLQRQGMASTYGTPWVSPHANYSTKPSPEWSEPRLPIICCSGWHFFEDIPSLLEFYRHTPQLSHEKVAIWLVEARGPFDFHHFSPKAKKAATQIRWIECLTLASHKNAKSAITRFLREGRTIHAPKELRSAG